MADAASLEALAAGYSAEVPFDEGPARQGAADNGEIPPRRLAENGGAGAPVLRMGGKKDENKRDKNGDNGKKEQKKDYKDYKKNGGYGGYGGKRSDNPDVLYGRDRRGNHPWKDSYGGQPGTAERKDDYDLRYLRLYGYDYSKDVCKRRAVR